MDFTDAATFYEVSTVNYLAAGSCNFTTEASASGRSTRSPTTPSTTSATRSSTTSPRWARSRPAVEGRLHSSATRRSPAITVGSPEAKAYLVSDSVTIDWDVTDVPAGVAKVWADLDGTPVIEGPLVLYELVPGNHTLTVKATDKADNRSSAMVTFTVKTDLPSLAKAVDYFYAEGKIDNADTYNSLMAKLQAVGGKGKQKTAANVLNAFINVVTAQSGKHITTDAADLLIADAKWILANPPITQ